MRKLFPLSPLMLAACATAPAPQPIPIHGQTPGHTCRDADTAQFIGQRVSEQVGAAIQRATNAAILRWAAPGMMLTMDFRADRVTVWYTPDRKITKVHCG